MPTYFRKTIKILPWVTLNLNKSGMSVSIGPRGAKLNISKKGAYFNTNIPGTGIYNKTKVGTALLWGLGTIIAVGLLGYALGVALQNFTLFVVMCAVAILAGIAAFFIAKHFTGKTVEASEEDEEEELPARKTTKKKPASTTKTEKKAKTTTKSTRTTKESQRADNAPAKAYTEEVERLMEVMAEAETVKDLNKAHAEILDIMYSNIKPMGVKVFGMEFDEALQTIEKDYAEGLKQLS